MANYNHKQTTATDDLVVGAIANYPWKWIEPWVVSLERSGYTGKKAVIAFNNDAETIGQLLRRNFYIKHAPRANRLFQVDRFLFLWQLLRALKVRYVISTDTRDLVFQTNPSLWLERYLPPFRLNVSSECFAHRDSEWNDRGMAESFGEEVRSWMKDKLVYNAGCFAGESDMIRDLCLTIYLMTFTNPYPNPDQFALNVLIQMSPWKEMTRFTPMADGWACQGMAAFAVDPAQKDQSLAILTEKEPVVERDSYIYPANSAEPFCIVHQYDRNPHWCAPIRRKYREGATVREVQKT